MEHRKPSVVVVDDYPLFRKGIADALTTNANFQILGLTGDEKTALSLIGLKPDIVIIDLDAKGFQPLNLLRLIKYRQPSCRAVMLMSSPNSSSNLMQAIRLDANGYLLRNIPIDEFVDQLKIVAQGEFEVLCCVASGLSNREIAQYLEITDGTVKVHVKHLLKKLHFRSRVEAAVWASERDYRIPEEKLAKIGLSGSPKNFRRM